MPHHSLTARAAWEAGFDIRKRPKRVSHCPLLYQRNINQLTAQGRSLEDAGTYAVRLCDATFPCSECQVFWEVVPDPQLVRWVCATCLSDYLSLGFYATGPDAPWNQVSAGQPPITGSVRCERCQGWFPFLTAAYEKG
jgi:hypothetical protein